MVWTVRRSNPSGRDFPNPSRPAHPASYTMGTGAWRWTPTPPSIAEVEGRVELYICSPSGPSWSVIGLTLPFTLTLSQLLYINMRNFTVIIKILYTKYTGYYQHEWRQGLQTSTKHVTSWCVHGHEPTGNWLAGWATTSFSQWLRHV